ncbi:CWF19-like protein 1 isoform X2 [Octopus sinensis]|uniref:CWF19-like protein 1 isoform X2 n=1 Tax=Octopus sinensis TaxID=2607531 RepID=A0A7E6F6N4_9MOLL|nr:CWF19-like protein 1 isoform X2 [Octopus sinensis]
MASYVSANLFSNEMENKQLKLLVSGDVEGNFKTLFSRVANIQKKNGPFDLLLCVGDFFGNENEEWNRILKGELSVPITVLILGANQDAHCSYYPEKEGSELYENILYLGKQGVFTTSSGLQIAYLSGRQCDTNYGFTVNDVDDLINSVSSSKQFKGVDILITSQWPKGVEKYAGDVEGVNSDQCGSQLISKLALKLRPRYHFVGLQGIFHERLPYRNHKVLRETALHCTRFISLAKVSNKQKLKFLYAFHIEPLVNMDNTELTKQPEDATECPYQLSQLEDSNVKDEGQQFFFDMKAPLAKGQKRSKDDEDKQKKKHKPAQPSGPCWFCLRGEKVEKQLVVSVGETTYMALAKGAMVPDHVLILPIGHYQSTVVAPSEVVEEIEKYKSNLRKYFKCVGKVVVFFERNYKTSHLQIQIVNVEAPYFYAEIPTGEKFLCRISKGFPLQFGRDVLASPMLLNMPERIDWKNCTESQEKEKQMAQEFKKKFKDFDFNFSS